MSDNLIPGRIVILEDHEEIVSDIAERMNYAGLCVSLIRSLQPGLCCITVPEKQEAEARAFLQRYFNASSEARKDEDLNYFRSSFLGRCPSFMSAEEKLKSTTNSIAVFLGVSAFTLIHLVNDILKKNQSMLNFDLVMAVAFTSFTVHTVKKSRQLKKSLKEETAFTAKVLNWFTGSYSAETLDHMLASASNTVGEAEMDILRMDLIRDYISREYSVEAPYLDYLTDLIFTKLYHSPQ